MLCQCVANKLTNCWCSSNFEEDECDNTTTAASNPTYGEYEDCDVSFAQPIDVFVPAFSVEPYVTKYYDATCSGYRWVDNYCDYQVCDEDCAMVSHDWFWRTHCHQHCAFGHCWYGWWCSHQCWQVNCRTESRICPSQPKTHEYYTYPCQHPFQGGDVVTVDAWGANRAKDTHSYNGELADNGMNGVKATHMIFRSDRDTGHSGFKICAVNPFKNPGGHAPKGGSAPEGVSPPFEQACPCGTNAGGTNPGGAHENPVSEGSGDNCFSNPAWPCDRDTAADRIHYDHLNDRDTSLPLSTRPDFQMYFANTAEASTLREDFMAGRCTARTAPLHANSSTHEMFCDMLKIKQETPSQISHVKSRPANFVDINVDDGIKWQRNVRSSLIRNKVKASIGCCVCQGGWIAGYDPQGDMATETELGEMTRPECILAAKATAGANAASIDDTATETVKGTCYAETNAHYSPEGWTSGAPRQACLFGV